MRSGSDGPHGEKSAARRRSIFMAPAKTPSSAAGKARAPASAQARNAHFLADLFRTAQGLAVGQRSRLKGERFFQGLVTAMAQVAFQVRGIPRVVGVLEDEAILSRHGYVKRET